MNRNKLKTYAPQARRDFIEAVTARAAIFGLTAKKIESMTEQGDVVLIVGRAFPKAIGQKRKNLEARIQRQGFDQTMEACGYTWFNRLVAIRFMELHGYLDHGYRVLSSAPSGNGQGTNGAPEIVQHAEHVDLPGLDKRKVIELKLDGTKEEELYRLLLVAQCNALHQAMPFLFESIDDETELLVPDHLLHSDSLVRKLVEEIPEEDWQEVEIIGWLYQFYISERKDEVIGRVVKSEDIPAATQLFTPNWIVKYLVQNSLGRQWMATYPNSPLRAKMEYYIEPAEQTPEVQAKLAEITPKSLNPEELTLLDPACGSGHILVEAYDLLKAIYQERGYRAKDIPRLILEKNLFGLEIDDRAAQLAAFALMMKARADDRSILSPRPLAGEGQSSSSPRPLGEGQGVRAVVQPHVLAIQESKGLDASEIAEALNQPILKEELPPTEELFEEIADDKAPLFSRKNLAVKGAVALSDVAQLIELFEHGKTFGSLIRVPKALTEKLPAIAQRVEDVIAHGGMFEKAAVRAIKPLVETARLLAQKYDAVVANPPYMGSKYMNPTLRSLARDSFELSCSDLYTMFIERGFEFSRPSGHNSMVTMHSWMFLSTYQQLRASLLRQAHIEALTHMANMVMGIAFGTAATVWRCTPDDSYKGRFCFVSLSDLQQFGGPARFPPVNDRNTSASTADFRAIPRIPIAYWISSTVRRLFAESKSVGDLATPTGGMTTGNNDRFLRHWFEVDVGTIGFDLGSRQDAKKSGRKWFPYNKGGEYRRWYGNNYFVVNWKNDGEEILDSGKAFPRSKDRYFNRSITWTATSSSYFGARHSDAGFIFDAKGSSCFASGDDHWWLLGLLSTKQVEFFLSFLNPTIEYQTGDIAALPVPHSIIQSAPLRNNVADIVRKCIQVARNDWNDMELSWEFARSPLCSDSGALAPAFVRWNAEKDHLREQMVGWECEINRLFINAYGLQDEVSPSVSEDQITLYRPNREEDIKRLISYAVGCMMGRYSLDEPGLIYAHGGNQGFDPAKYRKFPADEDGIIPVTDFDWFADDAASRFQKFIATAWPAEHLEENLKFVAESLGPKNGESPRATIRRYLAVEFFKHHLSMYKKRPTYWLFTSGRQRGFQALVYLHRYNEGTLARMRTEYVIPLLGKMTARIKQLGDDITAATSTAHKKRLEKEKATLTRQLAEVQAFDEKLRHYADQRIALDLDDGVKVNYRKFSDPDIGDILAEVRAITGGSSDE